MAKTTDLLPRLMHECFRDLLFSITVGIGLIMVSIVSSASINPTMKSQQNLQYKEDKPIAQVILKSMQKQQLITQVTRSYKTILAADEEA